MESAGISGPDVILSQSFTSLMSRVRAGIAQPPLTCPRMLYHFLC